MSAVAPLSIDLRASRESLMHPICHVAKRRWPAIFSYSFVISYSCNVTQQTAVDPAVASTLFELPPFLSSDGSLRFKLAPYQFGNATFRVVLTDPNNPTSKSCLLFRVSLSLNSTHMLTVFHVYLHFSVYIPSLE